MNWNQSVPITICCDNCGSDAIIFLGFRYLDDHLLMLGKCCGCNSSVSVVMSLKDMLSMPVKELHNYGEVKQ